MTLIKDVPAVFNYAGQVLRTQEDYKQYVDEPVRKAVILLNKNGIQTNYSSANCAGENASIRIPSYALSAENLKILESLGFYDPNSEYHDDVWLEVPMKLEDGSNDISLAMLAIVEQLKSQNQ